MELVSPGIGLIFWMIVAFGLLLFILGKFVWPPILRALHERESAIENSLHQAEAARRDMESLKFSNEQLLKEAKEERDALMRDARKVREKMIEDARVKASEESDRLIESAREKIQHEKMAAIVELKNVVANLSVEIAQKLIQKELSNPAESRDLIDKSINEIKLN